MKLYKFSNHLNIKINKKFKSKCNNLLLLSKINLKHNYKSLIIYAYKNNNLILCFNINNFNNHWLINGKNNNC